MTHPRSSVRALVLGLVVAWAAAAPAGSAAAEAPPVPAAVAAKLDARLDAWRTNNRAPGVAAAIRFPDGSLWLGASGDGAVGKDARLLTPATPSAIASLTKTFVAALVLQLVEQGRLSLDDPLSRWMPGYPRAKSITIKQLLSHRSGIFDYFANPTYERKVFKRPLHHWTVPEILALRGPRYCQPNTCFHYSNTNYVILGQVVRKVTGKTPARLIRNRFLKPLGLTDTYFQGQEPIRAWAAMGYWSRPHGYKGWSDGTDYRPNTSAATVAESAGAMISSVRDVSDWQDALLGGRVLAPESLARMLRFDRKSGYGLGMRRAWLDGIAGIGHGGSLRGYVAIMYRLPDLDIDVVLLTNLGNVSLQGLADQLTKIVLKNLPAEPPPP